MLTQLNLYNFSSDFLSSVSGFDSQSTTSLTPPYSPYENSFVPAFYAPMTLNEFDKFKLFTSPRSSNRQMQLQLPLTPPLSNSPPTARSPHSATESNASAGESQSQRTQSVIMRVEDQKIVPVISNQLGQTSSSSESEDDIIICKWKNCYRIFDTLESLATHVTQAHAVAAMSGLYYCNWEGCVRSDRGFNARYKMLVHVRIHTKEKPHHCTECPKSFSRAENLKIHIRSHSGEKPYVCPVAGCNKAYSNSSDRFKHTRTHSTEKPYFCKFPSCSKRYTDPSSLRKHVKTFKHLNITAPAATANQSPQKKNNVYTTNSNGNIKYSQSNTKDLSNDSEKHMFADSKQNQAITHTTSHQHQYIHQQDYLQDYQTTRDIYSLELEQLFKENTSIVSPKLLIRDTEYSKRYWINEQLLPTVNEDSMDIDTPLDLSLRKRVR